MNPKAYSTFRSPIWPAFKDACKMYGKPHDEPTYLDFAGILCRAIRHPEVSELMDRTLASLDLLCLFLWKFRRIRHYFLAPGVADFCADSVKELSADYSNVLPDCPPVPAPDGGGPFQSGFAIHFPANERDRSIICVPNFHSPLNETTSLLYFAAATNGDDVMVLNRESSLNTFDDRSARMAKTIFGFSLYIAAFPDALHDGDPGEISLANHYRGAHTAVGRTPVVDEEERAARSPHWRRGHFHLLSHPRFKQKRFQSVYVKGCFVRGEALEVEAPAAAAATVPA